MQAEITFQVLCYVMLCNVLCPLHLVHQSFVASTTVLVPFCLLYFYPALIRSLTLVIIGRWRGVCR